MSVGLEMSVLLVRACTAVIRMGGRVIVTDPWFSRWMRFLPAVRPGILLSEVPCPDLILLSHLHADHFEPKAVASLMGPGTIVVGPGGTRKRLPPPIRPWVREVKPGDSLVLPPGGPPACGEQLPRFSRTLSDGGGALPAVPDVEAEALRVEVFAMEHTFPPPPENGYLISTQAFTLFFAGDAAYSEVFACTGASHKIDVAMLPVGGTLILGRRTVMNPPQALQAALDLKARFLIPTHPGGEWMPLPPLSLHPGRKKHAAKLASRKNLPLDVVVLQNGAAALFRRASPGGEITVLNVH